MIKEFTQEEQNIVKKLEAYAKQIDKNIDTGKEMDFDELFSFLKYISTLNIDERIKSYSDYLYGAALPMYDLKLTETDYTDEPELKVITESTSWLNVLDKSTGVDFNELNERLLESLPDKLKAHIKDYNQLWDVMMGYKHYWYIKKHRLETGNKSPYSIHGMLGIL
jgi:hypothetical protein